MLSEATEHRLRNVFANHPAVRAAYVFGSVAADRERDSSDLDLGIVVDSDRWEPTHDKVPLVTDCMEAAKRDWIDLVVLNGAPLVVQFEALRPNVLLYARDDFHPGRFFSKVARMYWDFEPHFRRQREALKERLQEKAHG
jgi:predicted nucleotidyltransferase